MSPSRVMALSAGPPIIYRSLDMTSDLRGRATCARDCWPVSPRWRLDTCSEPFMGYGPGLQACPSRRRPSSERRRMRAMREVVELRDAFVPLDARVGEPAFVVAQRERPRRARVGLQVRHRLGHFAGAFGHL